MKKVFLSALLVLGLLISNSANAKQYSSDEYHCQINFPTDYEEEVNESTENKTISITAVSGSMIYLLTIIVYADENVDEDVLENNDYVELVKLITSCSNLGAKIKAKKHIFSFNVGDEKGYYAKNIKAKLNGEKYTGNYYVIMRDKILYQFTALGLKKGYNDSQASRFENSFQFK